MMPITLRRRLRPTRPRETHSRESSVHLQKIWNETVCHLSNNSTSNFPRCPKNEAGVLVPTWEVSKPWLTKNLKSSSSLIYRKTSIFVLMLPS
mmetsp:Transcript_12199/g.25960  ORF Transcript_12199/g.25960 Transcript_12199/m.25960 type:complete len:93 (+) Transcript_12199:2549-2827(+)